MDPWNILHPPEVTTTGPSFINRGSPGGVASEDGRVYLRVQGGIISYSRIVSLYVCVCVCPVLKWQFTSV